VTKQPRHSQSGLTLIELMISILLSSLIVAGALSVGFTMMNGYRDNREMTLVDRSARVSLEILADALRNAVPGVPDGAVEDGVGCGGQIGVQVTNSTTDPDELLMVYASGGVVTSTRETFTHTSTTIKLTDATGLADGDYIVVTEPTSVEPVKAVIVQIATITPNGSYYDATLIAPNVTCPAIATFTFSPLALVVRAKIARFYIEDSAATGNVPTLMMDPDAEGPEDPEPVAEGIEDMQIAVGVDADVDGEVFEDDSTTDEWHYNVAGDLAPGTPTRAFRVTLVAIALRDQSNVNSYIRPEVEDRAGASAADPFRRRVLSTTVEMRNIAGSP
jgi:prepilin-type N-terminal cleavage/methylation domain-containing protein